MNEKFKRLVNAVKGYTQLQFLNLVTAKLEEVRRYIRLGYHGVYSRWEIVERFSRLMLKIANFVPDSFQAIVVWSLQQVRMIG